MFDASGQAAAAPAQPDGFFPKERAAQDAYVIRLLQRCGLLTLQDIFNNGIHLQPYETRNRNISVRIQSKLAVHVKLPSNAGSRLAIEEEKLVLDHLALHLAAPERQYVPLVRSYDVETGALITGFLEGTCLGRDAGLLTTMPVRAIEQLGRLLRAAHASSFTTRKGGRELPFASGLLRPALSYVHNASAANMQLLRLVQNSAALRQSIRRLEEDWRPDGLIHGDMKLENLLLLKDNDTLALLDWEYARQGDPRWDIGSLIGELIYLWVAHTVNRDLGGGDANPLALPRLRLLAGALIGAYARANAAELMRECADYTAARLLQSVFEVHKFRTEIDLTGVRALQAAENIAGDPAMFEQFISLSK